MDYDKKVLGAAQDASKMFWDKPSKWFTKIPDVLSEVLAEASGKCV